MQTFDADNVDMEKLAKGEPAFEENTLYVPNSYSDRLAKLPEEELEQVVSVLNRLSDVIKTKRGRRKLKQITSLDSGSPLMAFELAPYSVIMLAEPYVVTCVLKLRYTDVTVDEAEWNADA